ncbi:hypothetical protein ACFLQR_05535 [Verrucomicrobiota bacterium]
MNILEQYLAGANNVIGERTPEEEKYDAEVILWLQKGKSIKTAIGKASEKYPSEALKVTEESLPDIAAHYDYLKEHEGIMQKLNKMK